MTVLGLHFCMRLSLVVVSGGYPPVVLDSVVVERGLSAPGLR